MKMKIKISRASLVKEALHEFIRGNVLVATQYFNHRVKAFMTEIVMGGGNPMKVENFSYKTEFQDRGPGHIHGILCQIKEDKRLVTLSKNERK